jgi:hypothetical protein
VAAICLACGKPIEQGDYRLVGVERGSWESRYAHRGLCEEEARKRFAPKPAPRSKRKKRQPAPEEQPSEHKPPASRPEPEIEQLTFDDSTTPDPFPDGELPWFGTRRRR